MNKKCKCGKKLFVPTWKRCADCDFEVYKKRNGLKTTKITRRKFKELSTKDIFTMQGLELDKKLHSVKYNDIDIVVIDKEKVVGLRLFTDKQNSVVS